MYKSKVDVPVLCEFFVRAEPFSAVFEQVRKARPSTLLLYQDGPRDNRPDDIENIQKCRAIAENIDWDCTVYKFYQEKNVGCDPSGFIAQRWALSQVDRCIILEDDCVPAKSFFPFCAELLEKYKNDPRVSAICGMNSESVTQQCPNSYFFSKNGPIWGWATWRRVVEQWDETYAFLDNPYALSLLKLSLDKKYFNFFIDNCKTHRDSKKAHFETILYSYIYLSATSVIIPTKNMVKNIGVGTETTHGTDNIKKYAKAIQRLFFMKTYEATFPLAHPTHMVVDDRHFNAEINRLGYHLPLKQFLRGVECFIRKIIYK